MGKDVLKPRRWYQYPYYPILLALYPILHLYAVNAHRLPFRYFLIPISFVLIALLVIWGGMQLVLRHWCRSSALVTLLFLSFFSYGHVHGNLSEALRETIGAQALFARHSVLLPLWIGLTFLGIFLILKSRWPKQTNYGFMNGIAFIMLLVCISTGWRAIHQDSLNLSLPDTLKNLTLRNQQETPDVYYIILDGYGRADVLKNFYNWDNSPFLKRLEHLRFYIADASNTNYLYTSLSLPSSLNMDYLQDLGIQGGGSSFAKTEQQLESLADHNRVFRLFRKLGYRVINVPSGLTISSSMSTASENLENQFVMSELTDLIIESTLVKPFHRAKAQRGQTLNSLQQLEKVVQRPGPKFVFAHLLCPHPPYVFRQDGSLHLTDSGSVVTAWDNHDAYANQVQHLNQRILKIVEQILKTAKQPPIIIIQGDHGPFLSDAESLKPHSQLIKKELYVRSAILNVYLVPTSVRSKLYPEITPVNSFRLVLEYLTGSKFPLHKDQTYSLDQKAHSSFQLVPEDVLRPNSTPGFNELRQPALR